jgi:DNA repair protein RadA/Sms
VRQVAQPDVRLKEAAKLGFAKGVIPQKKKKKDAEKAAVPAMKTVEISHVRDIVAMFAEPGGQVRYAAAG